MKFWKFPIFLPTFSLYSAPEVHNYDHILRLDTFSIHFNALKMAKKVMWDARIVDNVIKPLNSAQEHDIITAE